MYRSQYDGPYILRTDLAVPFLSRFALYLASLLGASSSILVCLVVLPICLVLCIFRTQPKGASAQLHSGDSDDDDDVILPFSNTSAERVTLLGRGCRSCVISRGFAARICRAMNLLLFGSARASSPLSTAVAASSSSATIAVRTMLTECVVFLLIMAFAASGTLVGIRREAQSPTWLVCTLAVLFMVSWTCTSPPSALTSFSHLSFRFWRVRGRCLSFGVGGAPQIAATGCGDC